MFDQEYGAKQTKWLWVMMVLAVVWCGLSLLPEGELGENYSDIGEAVGAIIGIAGMVFLLRSLRRKRLK